MKADTEIRLSKAMRRLMAEATEAAPPPELESILLGKLDRAMRLRRRRIIFSATAAGALAASLAVIWMAPSRQATPPPTQTATIPTPVVEHPGTITPLKRARKVARQPLAAPEQPFVPIPYVTPLEPYERFDVVRMELPVAALISAGFDVQSPDTGALAEADVVVGQDGRARAVRVISISNLN